MPPFPLARFSDLVTRQCNTGTRFSVRVQPRASRNEIVGVLGGALKVKLSAPPVDGAANAGLIDLLADELGVPKRRIRIVLGESARTKVIEIANV